jgi:O-antigen/teichoic acid export membrane protein
MLAAPWLSASLLDIPGQAGLLRLTLLGVVATALSGAVSAMLQATSQFGRLTVVMLANAVVTAMLALLLVVLDALTLTTAIVVLGIIPSLICTALGYRLLPGRWPLGLPTLTVVRPTARALLRFGSWLWVAGLLGMVASQVDVLLLNHWGSAATVGTYALAVGLASKADVVNQSLHAVLLPAASGLRSAEDVRSFVRRGVARSAVVGLMLLVLIPLARPLIGTIYGARYLPAVGLFQALLVVALLDLFITPLVMLAYTFDRPRLLAAHGLARVVGLGGGALLLIPGFGASGAVAARLAGSVAAALVVLVFLYRVRSSSVEIAVEPI